MVTVLTNNVCLFKSFLSVLIIWDLIYYPSNIAFISGDILSARTMEVEQFSKLVKGIESCQPYARLRVFMQKNDSVGLLDVVIFIVNFII